MTLPVDALEAFGHREVPNGPTLRSRAWGTLKISSAAKRPDAIMPAEMSSGAKFPKNVGHPPVRRSLDQRSMSPVIVASLIVMLCLLPAWTGVQAAKTEKGRVPPRLRGAVGCLAKAHFVQQYDLSYLGLKVGDWAWVRYKVGSIPERGDTPGVFNIVVYSPDGKKGILLFADPDVSGGFNAIVNAYHLHRHGSKWSADYGNGGYVMYEAIGKFVTKLSHRPRYRIRLTLGGNECKSEGE